MKYEVVENKHGFLEVMPKPSAEELRDYYNNEYFTVGTYSSTYSDAEKKYKNLAFVEAENILAGKKGKLLDVGCGEGYSLAFFKERGWEVKGLDFTTDGIERENPDCLPHFTEGNIFELLDQMISESSEKYDFIICNNVLEHVVDPLGFLERFKKLLSPEGICRIQVPNDYSPLQMYLKENKLSEKDYWFAPPAHLSYFNKTSLVNTMNACGYNINNLLGDFPIELFLLNKDSNYALDSSKGPLCHKSRVELENLLHSTGVEEFMAFRKGMGESGLGRNLIAYCSLSK